MNAIETPLEGVLLFEPTVYVDERGFFLERFHASRYREYGIDLPFVQDNHSRSVKGTLRGLHFQKRSPQGKLVEVVQGRVFDVVVDVRPGSTTFGQWHGVELSDENHYQLWVPPGFAHGFCALSENADLLYKCTAYYDSEDEGGIAWNDPDLDITWPVDDPLLSTKDNQLPFLSTLEEEDLPLPSMIVVQ
ncbi:MAG: dTDP-4-dehydrorhamnose 3,5-epimerase [Bacteroidetes bacterium]|nr:dTDP-4-dehydrorhamnose 3,5-epimerase [Bacteroidota bacterium]